jgi:hypothetical protein
LHDEIQRHAGSPCRARPRWSKAASS